jgi:hypothetical protein
VTEPSRSNRYSRIIEHIFFSRYQEGANEVEFRREEFEQVAQELGIRLPKNLGDIVYSLRYRMPLPPSITAKAPPSHTWVIRPAGRARYRLVAIPDMAIVPSAMLAETKVPDATPGLIAMYSLNDEQALLAKLRYNRLIDTFTGITCYSLQNHLRTTVPGMGQVETDEIYVGIDRRGAHYVFPVQAKGGRDRQNIVQIEQDFAVCALKFPSLICRAIGAQFMQDNVIALFEFEESQSGIVLVSEKHYRLVPPDELTAEDLNAYRERLLNS